MKIPENLWLQDIKKTEYIFLAVKSIAVILLITYVFYESFLPIFFMIPIWVIYARDGLRDLCRKKEKEFRVQFSNAIQAMGAALKAGYSVENAIREAEKDLAPMYEENVRIRKEFRKMVHQLDMKMPAVSVMEQFSERMKQEDTEDFVTVFSSAKMSGGDSISIIRNAVKIISGKIDTEQEIQTMFASKKLEFEIMCAVPFFIILYMKLTFGEFLSVLYENAAGRCFMTICLIVYIAAYSFGRKIIHIEVCIGSLWRESKHHDEAGHGKYDKNKSSCGDASRYEWQIPLLYPFKQRREKWSDCHHISGNVRTIKENGRYGFLCDPSQYP